jgi:hypothetical protein
LEAALSGGVPHGGWCPAGRRAEDGRIPSRYCLQETSSWRYAVRTARNVVDSDATVVFTFGEARGGSRATVSLARRHHRPCLQIDLNHERDARIQALALNEWLEEACGRAPVLSEVIAPADGLVLNVAGSRESNAPGIEARVYRIISILLSLESA